MASDSKPAPENPRQYVCPSCRLHLLSLDDAHQHGRDVPQGRPVDRLLDGDVRLICQYCLGATEIIPTQLVDLLRQRFGFSIPHVESDAAAERGATGPAVAARGAVDASPAERLRSSVSRGRPGAVASHRVEAQRRRWRRGARHVAERARAGADGARTRARRRRARCAGAGPARPPPPRPRSAIVLMWPASGGRLGSAVVNLGDPLLTTWILAWDVHALRTAPLRFFDANMFHPHRWALAYTEHLLGLVPLRRPRAPRGRRRAPRPQPRLARHVSADRPRDVLAGAAPHRPGRRRRDRGVLYAFSPFRIGQLGHVQILSHQWLPSCCWGSTARPRAAGAGGRGPRRGRVHAPGPVVRLSGVLRRDRRRGLPRLARAPRHPATARPPDPPAGRSRAPWSRSCSSRCSLPYRFVRDEIGLGPEPQRGPALRGDARILSGGAGGEPVARQRPRPASVPGKRSCSRDS